MLLCKLSNTAYACQLSDLQSRLLLNNLLLLNLNNQFTHFINNKFNLTKVGALLLLLMQ